MKNSVKFAEFLRRKHNDHRAGLADILVFMKLIGKNHANIACGKKMLFSVNDRPERSRKNRYDLRLKMKMRIVAGSCVTNIRAKAGVGFFVKHENSPRFSFCASLRGRIPYLNYSVPYLRPFCKSFFAFTYIARRQKAPACGLPTGKRKRARNFFENLSFLS